jgi:chromosome segregation ATPase
MSIENVAQKKQKLKEFQDHSDSILQAIATLEHGIAETNKLTADAQKMALNTIDDKFQRIFQNLVPQKQATLYAPKEDEIEVGFSILVSNERLCHRVSFSRVVFDLFSDRIKTQRSYREAR